MQPGRGDNLIKLTGAPRTENTRLLGYALAFLLTFALPCTMLVVHSGLALLDRDLAAGSIAGLAAESGLLPKALAWFATNRAEQYDALGSVTAQPPVPEIAPILDYIPETGWRQIQEALITNEILAGWSYQTYDAFSEWLGSSEALPNVGWDMQPLRAQLLSDRGRIVIAIAFASLPACTSSQLQAFETRLTSAQPGQAVLYEPCQHPPPWYQDQFDAYLDSLGRVAAGISDTFNLTAEVRTAEDPNGVGVGFLKVALWSFTWGVYLAPMFCTGLLLLIRYLIGPIPVELGKTIGVALTFGGASTLLISTAYRPVIVIWAVRIVSSEVPAVLHPLVTAGIGRLADPIFPPLRTEGAVLLVCGVLVMLWGASILRRNPPAAWRP